MSQIQSDFILKIFNNRQNFLPKTKYSKRKIIRTGKQREFCQTCYLLSLDPNCIISCKETPTPNDCSSRLPFGLQVFTTPLNQKTKMERPITQNISLSIYISRISCAEISSWNAWKQNHFNNRKLQITFLTLQLCILTSKHARFKTHSTLVIVSKNATASHHRVNTYFRNKPRKLVKMSQEIWRPSSTHWEVFQRLIYSNPTSGEKKPWCNL